MKCMLVFPAWEVGDYFPQEFGGTTTHRWHPLGLLYLGARLIQEGHDVLLLDGAFWTHQQILDEFRRFQPEFVGVHANCPVWRKAMLTAQDIKAINSRVFVSVGGPAAIGWRNRCLEQCAAFDCVHTGEGEYTITDVASRVAAGRAGELHDIAGIIFRDGAGEIVVNPDNPPIRDLDGIPFPARHLLGKFVDKYRPNIGTFRSTPVFSMITSRGCSHAKCLYCFRPDRSVGARFRSPASVVDEMEECVKRYGAREIKFLDDTFTADPGRVSAICEEIGRRGLRVDWFASSRVDAVNRKMLAEMKKAGCWAILYGVESGVQKNLDALKKGVTVDQAREAVRDAQAVGLKVSTPFILGIPGETFEEGLASVKFAMALNGDMVNFHTLTPFPGTELYDHVDRYGTMSSETDELTFETAAFVPFTMTRAEVLRLKQMAFRMYYGRVAYGLKRVLGIRSRNDLVAILHGIRTYLILSRDRNIFSRRWARS